MVTTMPKPSLIKEMTSFQSKTLLLTFKQDV